MAWSLVQQAHAVTSAPATTLGVTIAQPVSGNLLVLCVMAGDDAASITNGNERITGVTQTNVTWTKAVAGQTAFANFKCAEIWYAVAGASAGTTVTPTLANDDAASSDIAAIVAEWSGNVASPFDSATKTTGSSTSPATPAIVPANGGSLVVACEGNSASPWNGNSSSYTDLTNSGASAGGNVAADVLAAYLVTGSSTSCAWTEPNSQWVACIAVFKPVPPPAAPAGTVWTFQQG